MTPPATSTRAATNASGSSTRTVTRTRSAQKLPTRESVPCRANPRASAATTEMPTAADTKFCTASPAIWNRWPAAASPEYHCQLVLVTNETAVFHAPAGSSGDIPMSRGSLSCSRPRPNRTSTDASEKPSSDSR